MSIPDHLQFLQPKELESLQKLVESLPEIVKKAEYSEMYGQQLTETSDASAAPGKPYNEVKRDIILLKYLKARDYDVALTSEMLTDALKWRKEFDPLGCASADHEAKFDKLGVITAKGAGGEPQVTNWNLYGAVGSSADRKKVFGDLEGFLRWRVGIMERSLAMLDFSKPGAGSMLLQIHDYKNVSFLRLDAETKRASKETIRVFQSYYPETLERKFFVNVPLMMQWVFGFVNRFLSRETMAKFVVLSDGKDLSKTLGDWVPREYGGKGGSIAEMGVKVEKVEGEKAKTEPEAVSGVESAPVDTATQADAKAESAPEVETKVESVSEAPTVADTAPIVAETTAETTPTVAETTPVQTTEPKTE